MTRPRGERVRVAVGLLLVLAVAWSVPAGRVVEDTKNDLYVDPWGFLGRALHLWDPQVTWGVLQNQGYGYLFPMGPVIGGLSEVVPVWVAQRLWWSLVLVAGYLATHGLLRALGVGSVTSRVVASVAYALSPRVLSTIGGLSSEALPTLLVPAVLLPVVLGATGRLTPRRAAALSGLAVLCCGGVNATATLLAAVPTGLYLVTRHRWWREPLTWWWAGATLAASAWWLGPLVVLGRWSPPFLDWIERSADVVRDLDALAVVSGSTHWLQLVVTGAGAWWPAGYQLAARPLLVVATVAVGAVGLAGLGLARLPERRWLLLCAGVGLALLLLAHPGVVGSPLSPLAQQALDGPLSPLRNIHKADPLLRLPLAVGLAHALGVARVAAGSRRGAPTALHAAVVLTVLAVVSPGLSGATAPPGSFTGMARQWVDAGEWLSQRGDQGRALVVPAARFGEYDWGRTIDEPIRPLSTVDHAVRDAVPLTPAGTIRFLDDVERRMQTGDALGGSTEVLRRLGVRWLVLRNDLDPQVSGQPSPAYARSSVRSTTGVTFAQGFGSTRLDAGGERVFPVEVYDLGEAAPLAVTQPVVDVVGVAGGAEDLAAVLEAGADGLVVLDGDLPADVRPGRRVVTDGNRARGRSFGATKGRDASSTLGAAEVDGTRDYRPWADRTLDSTVVWQGIAGVTASSSTATRYTLAGFRPDSRPAAALDDDPTTSWTTFGDERPTIEVALDAPTSVPSVRVEGVRPPPGSRGGPAPPTRVRVSTDRGSVVAGLPPGGGADVTLPAGATTRVRVEVLATDDGPPAEVLTGLSTLRLTGVDPVEVVATPAVPAARPPATTVLLGTGLPAVSGCVHPEELTTCLGRGLASEGGSVLTRRVTGAAAGTFTASGSLLPRAGVVATVGLAAPGLTVTASSRRADAPAGAPEGAVDGDPATAWSPEPGDRAVELDVALSEPVDVAGLRLVARRDWARRARPVVAVSLDGREEVVRASADGHLAVQGSGVARITLTFLPQAGRAGSTDALELEELEVIGADLPRPAGTIALPCGSGPRLVVDGREVATRATGPRSALRGVGSLQWASCTDVVLPASSTEVELRGVPGWDPATAVLRSSAARAEGATPLPQDVVRRGPTLLTGTLDPGPERLLALDVNSNAGWVATLDGVGLAPLVVDGFRQGYLVPDGAAGALEVRFAPDGTYRAALAGGALLVLLLALGLVLPDRGRPRAVAASRPRVGPWAVVVAVVGGATLLLGPWGGLAAAAGLAAGRPARWRRFAPWAGAAVVTVGGVAAAVLRELSVPLAAEVASTLLVSAGAALVASALVARPSASPGARRTGGSATPAPATPAPPAPAGGPARR